MRSLRNLRFLAEYGLIRIAIAALRLLPLDTASNLTGSIVAVIGPRTSLHRRAVANITAALPELSDGERQRILQKMWYHTGQVIAETLMLDRLVLDRSRTEIVNQAGLEKALRSPGARIGISLHIGNWEIIAKAISLCGGNLAGVYRPIRNPYLDRYVHARREKLYPAGLLFKGTKGGTMPIGVAARVAIDFLRHGGQLGLIADQVDDGAPFTVPFFGHAAKFTVAPALFARRLRAKIYVAQCLRQEECSRFRVEWRELEVPLTPEADADIKTLTAIMVAQFETWIRQAPEQWMWWQRRSIGTLQS